MAVFVALLALVFQALIPPGYMVAQGHGSTPVLSICTGHGPLNLSDPSGRQAPPGKRKTGGVCAFAGHGAAPILASPPIPVAVEWSQAAPAGPAPHRHVFIGRGLAAPPPARGPPAALA